MTCVGVVCRRNGVQVVRDTLLLEWAVCTWEYLRLRDLPRYKNLDRYNKFSAILHCISSPAIFLEELGKNQD